MKSEKTISALEHLSNNDPILKNLIEKHGKINLKKRKKYFLMLCSNIIGQQLSSKAADAIWNRVYDYLQGDITPEKIYSADIEELRALGISYGKISFLHDLSSRVINKQLSLIGFSQKEDNLIINELTKVKGIGPWTAHMFLIFTLGRENVLPTGDLGIKKSIMINYRLKKLPDEKRIISLAQKNNWAPFSSYASLYLWRSLDNPN